MTMIMLAAVRMAVTAGLLAGLLAAAGCGGDDDGDRDTGGLAREAGATIEELERAIAAREFEHVCAELLSAEVRRQAGGGDCTAMLERTSAGVRRPQIEVRRIRIEGEVAIVDVVSTAVGQARVPDTIRLVREGGRYRISSLSG